MVDEKVISQFYFALMSNCEGRGKSIYSRVKGFGFGQKHGIPCCRVLKTLQ
jgi:hypothetical protein